VTSRSRLLRRARASEPIRASFRADIEGLRAVAVLLVFLDHLVGAPRGGFIGVDVFFVLSGFLITGLLVREAEARGRVSIEGFYVRRARRILPIALLTLLLTNVVAHAVFVGVRLRDTLTDTWWSLGFLANKHFADLGTDYFSNGRPSSPLQHFWSLAVEEQFYLVWPLAVLLLATLVRRHPHRLRWLLLTALAPAAVASFAWNLHLTATEPTAAYFSTPGRAWELALGGLVALLGRELAGLPVGLRRALSWTGLAGIAASAFVINGSQPFPGTAALAPVVATAALVAAGDVRGGVGSTLALGHPVARYVGRISYSLYLWHLPAIVLAGAYFGDGSARFYLVGAGAPLVLAVLGHHLVEDPVRRSKLLEPRPFGYRRSPVEWSGDRQRVLVAATLVVTLVLAVATLRVGGATAPQGEETAVPVSAAALVKPSALRERIMASLAATSWGRLSPGLDNLDAAVVPEWKQDSCINVTVQRQRHCRYGSATAPHLAFLVGDSYAVSYAPAIRAALEPKGWAVQVLTMANCPFQALPTSKRQELPRPPFKECLQHRAEVLDLVKQQRPELLIGASGWIEVNALVDGFAPGDDRNEPLWGRGVSQQLAAYKRYVKREVLIGSPPSSGNLQSCVTRTSKPSDCTTEVNPIWYAQRQAEQAAATANGAGYVDVLPWFCVDGRCPAVIGRTPVYWDGFHITAAYSRTLTDLLAPSLRG
jgi:peptidoglycan/LPS O-acetylase OafA/YrhL